MRTNTIRLISLFCNLAAIAATYLLTHLRLFTTASSTQTRSISELASLCSTAPNALGCSSIQLISLAATAVSYISILLLFANLVNLRRTPWRGFVKLPKSKEAAEEAPGKSIISEAAGLFAVIAGCVGFVYFLNQNKFLAILLLIAGMAAYGILSWRR
jgi:hypothetical protein